MAVIREDKIGLYANSGGYIARPRDGVTRFKKGDRVKDNHFGGSPLHGIGKDETCKRGEYLETWIGCGMAHEHTTYEQRKEQYDWYMNYTHAGFGNFLGD